MASGSMFTLMAQFMKVTGIMIRKKEKVDISTLTDPTTLGPSKMIYEKETENLRPRPVLTIQENGNWTK